MISIDTAQGLRTLSLQNLNDKAQHSAAPVDRLPVEAFSEIWKGLDLRTQARAESISTRWCGFARSDMVRARQRQQISSALTVPYRHTSMGLQTFTSLWQQPPPCELQSARDTRWKIFAYCFQDVKDEAIKWPCRIYKNIYSSTAAYFRHQTFKGRWLPAAAILQNHSTGAWVAPMMRIRERNYKRWTLLNNQRHAMPMVNSARFFAGTGPTPYYNIITNSFHGDLKDFTIPILSNPRISAAYSVEEGSHDLNVSEDGLILAICASDTYNHPRVLRRSEDFPSWIPYYSARRNEFTRQTTHSVSLSRKGDYLAASGQRYLTVRDKSTKVFFVSVWNINSSERELACFELATPCMVARLSPDGWALAASSEGPNEVKSVRFWPNWREHTNKFFDLAFPKIDTSTAVIGQIKFSLNNTMLAVAVEGEDFDFIAVWEIQKVAPPIFVRLCEQGDLENFTRHPFAAFCFSPDGESLFTAGLESINNNLMIWDLVGSTNKKPLAVAEIGKEATDLECSADMRLFSVSTIDSVEIFDFDGAIVGN